MRPPAFRPDTVAHAFKVILNPYCFFLVEPCRTKKGSERSVSCNVSYNFTSVSCSVSYNWTSCNNLYLYSVKIGKQVRQAWHWHYDNCNTSVFVRSNGDITQVKYTYSPEWRSNIAHYQMNIYLVKRVQVGRPSIDGGNWRRAIDVEGTRRQGVTCLNVSITTNGPEIIHSD